MVEVVMKLLVLVLGIVMLGCFDRAVPPSPPRHTALNIGISTFVLPNGLHVVEVRDPGAREVQVTMRYAVGNVDEPADQQGVAHLVEHLLYLPVVDGRTLFEHLEGIASYFNGQTTFDTTTYEARADKGELEALLAIETARLEQLCGELTDAQFAREREVVVNELRQRSEPFAVLDAIDAGVYPAGHPYHRAMAGDPAKVGAITRAQACAFASAHYSAANAVLVVAGDIPRTRLIGALGATLGHLPHRPVVARAVVPAVAQKGERTDVPVPLDSDAVMVAWPLPEDLGVRAKLRAMAPALVAVIDEKIKGQAITVELGGERAPVFALIALPKDEAIEDTLTAVTGAVADLPSGLRLLDSSSLVGKLVMSKLKQGAIHDLYERMEAGSARDQRLAADAMAGRDPGKAVGEEFVGLNKMSRGEAADVASAYLTMGLAHVVVMHATDARPGHDVPFVAPPDDLGARRSAVDPAAADRPAEGKDEGLPAGATTRTLPNGLKVVLLPVTNSPAIDVRLVFAAGTVDDPAGARGAALVAAHALTWDVREAEDLLGFIAAGGATEVDVEPDTTTFSARGVDMHVDYLLTGLHRLVVDGGYGPEALDVLRGMRKEAARTRDSGGMTDRWRRALYGNHPYARAGLIRFTDARLTVADAKQFRRAHFTPDNATLVIAGRFDAALADRWIDYLFSGWHGQAVPARQERPTLTATSLGRVEATTQVNATIAFPADGGDRGQQLVAAEMLAEVAGDVRHALGASYGLNAALAEARLADQFVIAGAVEAGRAHEALALLRDRLVQLREDHDAAARVFVLARARVLTRLGTVASSSRALGDQVERDVATDRAPLADLATASAVRALTLDKMTAVLATLDFHRAAILLRGPKADVDRAFATLERTPEYLPPELHDNDDAPTAPGTSDAPGDAVKGARPSDSDDSDTDEKTTLSPPYTFAIAGGLTSGTLSGHDISGYTATVQAGYRVSPGTSVGGNLSIASSAGTFATVTPIGIEACVQFIPVRRLWLSALGGLLLARVNTGETETHPSIGVAAEAGVDLVSVGSNMVGLFGRVEATFVSDISYQAATFGIGLRR